MRVEGTESSSEELRFNMVVRFIALRKGHKCGREKRSH